MARVAGHAGRDIGYGISWPVAGHALLGKVVQFFLKGHIAGCVLIEHSDDLRRDIGDKAVAALEMLIGHYLVARHVGPGGRRNVAEI